MSRSATVPARRHRVEGGYSRGIETRARIIAAALDAFGMYGFGGTSTRLLADRAGVTLPTLQYYFNDKQGLYLACAEHIADGVAARLGPAIEKIAAALADEAATRPFLRRLLDQFLGHFADLFLGAHELEKWVLFIIREQAQPTKAFDIIYACVMRKVATHCAALVARLTDRPGDDIEARLQAIALLGQIIFFRTGRTAVLRLLEWRDFDAGRLALVKGTLRGQTTAALSALRTTARRTP